MVKKRESLGVSSLANGCHLTHPDRPTVWIVCFPNRPRAKALHGKRAAFQQFVYTSARFEKIQTGDDFVELQYFISELRYLYRRYFNNEDVMENIEIKLLC